MYTSAIKWTLIVSSFRQTPSVIARPRASILPPQGGKRMGKNGPLRPIDTQRSGNPFMGLRPIRGVASASASPSGEHPAPVHRSTTARLLHTAWRDSVGFLQGPYPQAIPSDASFLTRGPAPDPRLPRARLPVLFGGRSHLTPDLGGN